MIEEDKKNIEITPEDFPGIWGEKLKKYPEAIPFMLSISVEYDGAYTRIPKCRKAKVKIANQAISGNDSVK